MLVPGLFLFVVSFAPDDYCLADSSSPVCAGSLDVYFVLWWRWFGALVLALQVRTAWLLQAWGGAGLCAAQQAGCSSQGDDVGCCTECLAPNLQGTQASVLSFCAEKTGVGKAGKRWLWAHVVFVKIIFLCKLSGAVFSWCWTLIQAVVSHSQPLQDEGSKLTSCCALPRCALSTWK